MIQKVISRILRRKHFWREVGFDELSQLYVSNMLRSFSLSLMVVFIPFYLYQQGYSIPAVFAFFGCWFVARMVGDIAAAHTVARFGPKHSMLVSCFLQIANAALLLLLPSYPVPLWLIALVGGMGASFFFIAFHVEFSKIKHAEHVGKELGSMQIFEKMAAVAGPLVGGLLGMFVGGRWIFVVGCLTLLCSLVPLFCSAEPIKTRQTLRFRKLSLGLITRDLGAGAGVVVENTLCINLWPFYIAVFALSGQIYGQLGLLASIAMLTSIFSAVFFGRYVDTQNARTLLRVSAGFNAFLHLIRPLVSSVWPVFAVGIANEIITTGYRMPFMKGMYAAADDLPGFRIVYIASIELFGDIIKSAIWFLLAMVALQISGFVAFCVGFACAAIASIFIMTERFKALEPRRVL